MTTTPGAAYPPELAVGVTSSRIAQISPAARTLHKAILRSFATTGRAPDPAQLADIAPAGSDVTELLRELHDHDVIRLDDYGQIRAAYPFSAVATTHVVTIDGGPTVWSMCAVDALGIADMLDSPVTITSTDPATGSQIRVKVRRGYTSWTPDTSVVFVGTDTTATGDDCCPPDPARAVAAAERCCRVMNFFASPDTAMAWRSTHPEVSGTVLTQQQALHLGVDIFGDLLHDRLDHAGEGSDRD